LQRRMNPHAANDGGGWEPHVATVPALPEVFLCNSWIFWGLFCNFWIVYYVVRFVLNLWYFVSCKNNVWVEHSKSDVCACFFFLSLIAIYCDACVFDKKNIKNVFLCVAYGQYPNMFWTFFFIKKQIFKVSKTCFCMDFLNTTKKLFSCILDFTTCL
jgi:hypothetical protein